MKGGANQRNNGPHQRNNGPHQRNNGPQQRNNGPQQRKNGPIQRNKGNAPGRFAPPAAEKVSFKEKFENKKQKFTAKVGTKNFKKKGGEGGKEEVRAFQGVSTDQKEKKPRLNKEELKKRYIAKKLMS